MVFHHPFEEYSRRIGSFPRKNKKLLKPPSLSEIRWISNQVPQRILELPVLSEPEIPENFQQAPWKRSFFRKKTRKTYSPGTQTQKLRTSWDEESKLHLKNGLFHVLPICQLKAKDLAPVTQTNIITSCRVAKHHWNKRAGLVMRSPHSRFSKRFTGCFMNLLTSWSNHLVILYNNCSQWNITIFAWKIPSKTGPWLSAAKRALRGTLRKQLFVSHSPILQSYIAWVFADRRVVSCCFNSLHKWFETLQLPEKLR